MTLKEQIISYCGIIVESTTPNQLGLFILKLLNNNETKNEILKKIDTITLNEWFHIQNKNELKKEIIFIFSPFKDEIGDVRNLIIDKVPEKDKSKVLNIFNDWFVSRLSNLKEKYKGWNIYSYKRSNGELIKVA